VLYRAVIRVRVDGRVTDELETPLGLRTVSVSASRGLELNGHPLLLYGGNVHHDNGPLGAAAFDRAEERRVQLLKAAGFNAIRTAHNPPSPAFLDACDRLGLLVMDEAFDGWARPKLPHDHSEFFRDWWRRDLEAMVRRDRNHPSVVMWSLGNEVYERGTPEGARRGARMAKLVRELDPTRPVTAGINGMGASGVWTQLDPLFATLDVTGYNYERVRYVEDHDRLPSRVMVGTESFPADAFASWAAVHSHPWVIGDFVWSALDYLGEAGIGRVFPPGEPAVPHWEGLHYPWHGAACGDIDITGWRRPVSHHRNIVWHRGETLSVAVREPSPTGEAWTLSRWAVPPAWPSWTWPGQEGRPLRVDVSSRHDAVRLSLNGVLVGETPTDAAHELTASFEVPYEPGRLRVVGVSQGRETEEVELVTAGDAVRIRLSPDRLRIRADGQDLSFVTVEIVDEQGRLRPDASVAVRYALEGPATIAGIGSGNLITSESYQANPRRVFHGRALVVLRSIHEPGTVRLTASAAGLEGSSVTISAGP
jgi:beta-galactosidase